MNESSLDLDGRCADRFHQTSDAKVRQCTDALLLHRSFGSLEPVVLEKRTMMLRLLHHVASSCELLPFRLSLIGRAGQARPKRLTRTVDLSHLAGHVIRLWLVAHVITCSIPAC
jgi:hypothetical protein